MFRIPVFRLSGFSGARAAAILCGLIVVTGLAPASSVGQTFEFVEPLCADCHGPESLFKYKFFHSEASRR